MIVNDSYALTIDELSQEVARLLKANDLFESNQDNRISPSPDMRTIRYYSSLGLIDRPSIEGRVAKYCRRHLLQILAIKTLQKAARPLSEIQERLYGLSEAELEAVVAAAIAPVGESPANSNAKLNAKSNKEALRPVYWREIVIEPGLKILAGESWIADVDQVQLHQKIMAAIETLKHSAPGANGEDT
jgi:DNA-binding transcriptional MerR regulator